MAEETLPALADDDPISSEIATLEEKMSDRRAWFHDTASQERYAELVEARAEGTSPKRKTPAEKEIADIEKQISTDRRGYFKDPKAQARYRELLAERDGVPLEEAPKKTEILEISKEEEADALTYWQSEPGQKILQEWQQHFGDYKEGAKSSIKLAIDFIKTIPEETRAEFEMQASVLPVHLRASMMAELASPYVPRDVMATPKQLDNLSTIPGGAELIEEWGHRAQRKYGVVVERISRIADRISDDEYESFAYFLDNISREEFKAVMNFLARSA